MGAVYRSSILSVLLLAAWSAPATADPVAVAPDAHDAPLESLKRCGRPLKDEADLDPLIARVGQARLVLLGEASHGTSEYYTWRATLSRRLIEEEGFHFIAVEGDWAPLYRLNRYVKWMDPDPAMTAREIMRTFDRWPTWMWANEETLALVEWLRRFNEHRPVEERVGFYGMDVYGEHLSLRKVTTLLRERDGRLADEVAEAYAGLEPYAGRFHDYARAVAMGGASRETEVRRVYERLSENMDRISGEDRYDFLAIKMNAKVVKNAEAHYRLMALPGADSWNARADHFYGVVDRLLRWYGETSRGIVWAHNTHVGDARMTAMAGRGERNIGQIARERLPEGAVVAVGFGSHRGTVLAGREWGAPMETMSLPPGRPGSAEDLMHRAGMPTALFLFDRVSDPDPLLPVIGHRAVGVVFDPAREHLNYVPTILPRRYDAFIFIDETRALDPIS